MTEVHIDCACPGRRHPDGDTVTLRETLDFRNVTAIRANIGMLEDATDAGDVYAVLTEGYVLYGIVSWTLRDERDKPIPVSRQAIREHILTRLDIASLIGDEANELYAEKVMLPLLARASNSSQPSPTEPTSAPSAVSTASSDRRPRPLKPSSTSTSQTDDTATTSSSLDGGSSSSPSSVSAA